MNSGENIQEITHIWTRLNPRWLLIGAFSGLGAGLAMMIVASLAAIASGKGLFFPLQLVGASVLGSQAMENGFIMGGTVGFLLHFGLSLFFGLVFAQFVSENSRKRILFLLGLLAGLCVWLFWSMMFMPSFNEPMTFLLPKLLSLSLHFVFGLTFGFLLVTFRPLFLKTS